LVVPLASTVFAYDVAIAGGRLYWVDDWAAKDIDSCALPDCAGGPIGAGVGAFNYDALVADPAATTIFWAARNPSDRSLTVIQAMTVGTGTKTPLLSGIGANAMAADNSYLYFGSRDTKIIEKIGFAGALRAALATSTGTPQSMAVCGVHLYWTDSINVYRIPLPNGVGTATVPVFGSGQDIVAVACDDAGVYWTNSVRGSGTVVMCPHAGCGAAPKVLALGQDSPWGIALDATSVYWVTFRGGGVLKVAK
jgi:hypothetical protein